MSDSVPRSSRRAGFLGAVLAALTIVIVLGATAATPQSQLGYEPATDGTRYLESRNGQLVIKVLVEEANLGSGEVEIAEITFPAGSQGGGHRHGAIEMFYVLSGTLEHVVNGESHMIEPGQVGIVKPGDTVGHRVPGDEPVKALVIWAPGGEVERIAQNFNQRPIRRDR